MMAMDLRGKELTEQLQDNAGLDSLQDRYYSGYIACIKDLLQVKLEEIQDNDNSSRP